MKMQKVIWLSVHTKDVNSKKILRGGIGVIGQRFRRMLIITIANRDRFT